MSENKITFAVTQGLPSASVAVLLTRIWDDEVLNLVVFVCKDINYYMNGINCLYLNYNTNEK